MAEYTPPPALQPAPSSAATTTSFGGAMPPGWQPWGDGWLVGNTVITSVSASRSTLESVASRAEDRQMTIAADGALIPIIFGQDRVGGMVATEPVIDDGHAYVLVVWCMGEADSLVTVTLNDEAPTAGVERWDKFGAAGQTVETNLQAAFAANGVTYLDTLPGVCYSVFKIPVRDYDGLPTFAAVVKGIKVKQTSGSTPAWSNVPARAVAAFIENTTWGMGRTVNWTSVAAIETLNSSTSIGEVRRTVNLTLLNPQFVDKWLPTLCAYAGCWPIEEGGEIVLIPNAPAASEMTFTVDNIVDGSMRLSKADTFDIPTVMRVRYTDTTVTPYRDGEAVVYAAGVLAGTTPWRDSSVPLPGVNRYSQAMREATERLNLLTLCDLSATFDVFDEGLKLTCGAVITVSHPIGLVSKLMRTTSIVARDLGRYTISATEYDAAAYSDLVVSEPTTVDTPYPLPTEPPVLTGLTAAEETYALDSGIFASRARLTWTAPTTFPFVRQYRVALRIGSSDVHAALVDANATAYATPPLQEGQTYTVVASIISSTGAVGTEASTLISVAGKSIVPGNVLTFTGFEVGGRVFLSWTRADNPTSPGTPDPDVWRYEVRRGTTSQAWGDAGVTVLDQTDGLRLVDEGAPAGTWRYQVKAIDSVGQYSTTAKTLDITVTTDSASFLVDSYDHTAPRWQNLLTYSQAFNSWANSSPAVTVTSDSTAAPDGTTTADTLADSSSSYCYLQSNAITAASAGEVCCAILRVKKDSTGSATRAALLRLYFSGSHSVDLVFDTSTGATHARVVGSAVVDASGSYDYGGGYWAFWISGHHASIAASNAAIYPAVGANATLSALTYSATTQGSIIAWGAQLVRSTYPAMYMATTSTADTTSGGYGMEAYTLAPTDLKTYYVTEDFIPFGTKYTSNLDTYTFTTGELSETHASMTSRWVGEAEDWGQTLSGQWTGTADITDVNGSHTSYFEYSTDGTTYTSVSGLSQKVTGRFARMKHEALTTSTMLVTVPTQNIRLDAVPRSETGTGTSSASTYTRITLANDYVVCKKLTVTAFGTTARMAVADNIVTGDPTTFDVYVFDNDGTDTKIVSDFRYEWQGV